MLFLAFSPYFSSKPYLVTPHQNRLVETILMSGHKIGFGQEMKIFIFKVRILSGALIVYLFTHKT